VCMIVIGADTRKGTHALAAVDEGTGRVRGRAPTTSLPSWNATSRRLVAGETAVTVRIGDVGVVLSDPADWLSGWRRADPRLLCRLLVWL
jgi:hypothetical protein